MVPIKLKTGALTASALCLALAAAACSSSSSTSSSPGTSAGASSAGASSTGSGSPAGNSGSSTGASGSVIPIGIVGSFSGPQGAALVGAQYAVNAWAASVNAHGGVAGHQVKVFVQDDAADAAKAITAVKTLIQADHVVAIVGEVSDQDQSFASYVESAGVPVVGGLPQDIPFMTNPDFYASGGNIVGLAYGGMVHAKQFGSKTGLFYCAEAPVCAANIPVLKAVGGPLNVNLSFSQSILATAPSYTAQCEALKSSGVQTYNIAEAQPIVAKVASACKQAGVTATLLGGGGTTTLASLSDPGEQGEVGTELDFPFTDSSTAATQEFQAAIKQYATGIGSAMGPSATYGWVAAKLFQAAVVASNSSTVTPASVKQGLYALPKGDTLGGIAPPLTFTAGKPDLVNCYFTDEVKNGTLVEPNGLKAACAPDAVANVIISQLTK
jgi:branched-chain amino acid transport system substrate-binding protein